jgi:hypothetical protein
MPWAAPQVLHMIEIRRFVSPRPQRVPFQARLRLLPERFALGFSANRYFALIAAE